MFLKSLLNSLTAASRNAFFTSLPSHPYFTAFHKRVKHRKITAVWVEGIRDVLLSFLDNESDLDTPSYEWVSTIAGSGTRCSRAAAQKPKARMVNACVIQGYEAQSTVLWRSANVLDASKSSLHCYTSLGGWGWVWLVGVGPGGLGVTGVGWGWPRWNGCRQSLADIPMTHRLNGPYLPVFCPLNLSFSSSLLRIKCESKNVLSQRKRQQNHIL